ncbi:MAG TPA: hypothetical protein VFK16_00570 [Gemmatimonadaceae bacterium]|jgi:hypothetical protein|nr:hypothetical protein [Gemmatimonadaceae bacterium]
MTTGAVRAVHVVAAILTLAAAPVTARAQGQADSNPPRPTPVAQPEVRVAARTRTPRPVWPTDAPRALPGAILPGHRIVAFYGNPRSRRMGILGELPPQEMLAKLDSEVTAWQRADPATPAIPALQLIVSVAQDAPGRDSMYRARMPDSLIDQVAGWATGAGALLFLDVQAGHSTVVEEVKQVLPYLARPTVHLALDPEFAMTEGGEPGERIGTLDAADVNRVIGMLDSLVAADNLPPKVLVVHRFTWHMVTNAQRIRPTPRVQVVIDMDGWGSPVLKEDSYRAYVFADPVQYTGFKLFYHNDTKAGHPLMTPLQVLRLFPAPLYIQYQ